MAVAVVMIHEHGDGLKHIRVAVSAIAFAVLATPLIVPIPRNVAIHDQIEQAVVIEVDPRGRGGPTAAANAGLLRHISECAVAVVVVEAIAAIPGYEYILVAVIVVIGNSDTHPVANALQSRFLGDVFKGSI